MIFPYVVLLQTALHPALTQECSYVSGFTDRDLQPCESTTGYLISLRGMIYPHVGFFLPSWHGLLVAGPTCFIVSSEK